MKPRLLLVLACIASLCISCSTKVERVEVDSQVDLSGYWNDTDSRLVSGEMIDDVLSRPWITEFVQTSGHAPAVIVGQIRNLSHEHINVSTFVADIERSLVNSGRVDTVASSTERVEVREERKDQELHASLDTSNPMGEELGADFILQGSINTIIDQRKKEQLRFYQVDLSLIDLADNRKVWLGQKKIKKVVKNPTVRW